jgi:hypothetical protein
MVYVIIYLQRNNKLEPLKTETKTFRSVEALIKYCFNIHKANYVTLEIAADSSFDYYVKLNDIDKWD